MEIAPKVPADSSRVLQHGTLERVCVPKVGTDNCHPIRPWIEFAVRVPVHPVEGIVLTKGYKTAIPTPPRETPRPCNRRERNDRCDQRECGLSVRVCHVVLAV